MEDKISGLLFDDKWTNKVHGNAKLLNSLQLRQKLLTISFVT